MSRGVLEEPTVGERLRAAVLGPTASRLSRWSEQVLLVPLLLWGWGAERFGEWLALSAVVGVLTLLDLGAQHRSLARMMRCYSRGEADEYTRLLRSSLGWCLAVAGGATFLVLVAAAFVPWHAWFDFETTRRGTAGLVVLLVGLQVAGGLPQSLLTGVYATVGEDERGERVTHARRAGWFAATLLGVAVGGGLVAVAALQLASLVAAAIWVARDLRLRHPEVPIVMRRADWREVDWSLAPTHAKPGLLTFGVRASSVLLLHGSTIVVGALLGAGAVAIFVTLRTLAVAIRPLTAAITRALWPELGTLEIRDRQATLRASHALAVKGVTAFALVGAVVLHHLAPWIVDVWTLGRLEHDGWLFGAFLALYVLQTPWITSSQFLLASKQRGLVVRCRLAAVPAALALAGLGAWLFGAEGAVLGILAGEALACGWIVPRATCHLLGQRPVEHLTGVLLPTIAIGLAAATCGRALEIPLWGAPLAVRALVVGLVMGGIVLFVSWKGWLEGWERKRLHDLLVGGSVKL